jgi:acetyl-CoA carboxylase biotin carboxylase subunit
MIQASVPVIPGRDGVIGSVAEARDFAEKSGYPVMIKASAGGGGKGIRIVRDKDELTQAFASAKAEARANFGDDALYMEKLIENAKHIEVQILADKFGNTVHLGERDCSMQRRNQKMIEEAPAVTLDEETRRAMGEAAVRAAKAVGYESAGTIEFLYSNGEFYFMEMNTRIQVEHPVTEAVTGIDLVKSQIMVAAGERLGFAQDDIHFSGHSIECRINAECPERGFAPSPGRIDYLLLPSGCLGLRVDSAAFAGYTIPPYYDSMIAKVITHGQDRSEAIAIMRRALSEFVITGVETNIDFQLKLLASEKFLLGEADTGLITRELS